MSELQSVANSAEGTAKVRCRMPLLLRKSLLFHRPDGSATATVDLIWTTPRRWGRLTASTDASWRVLGIGPFVLAVRLGL
jgi:hypothetical protein